MVLVGPWGFLGIPGPPVGTPWVVPIGPQGVPERCLGVPGPPKEIPETPLGGPREVFRIPRDRPRTQLKRHERFEKQCHTICLVIFAGSWGSRGGPCRSLGVFGTSFGGSELSLGDDVSATDHFVIYIRG